MSWYLARSLTRLRSQVNELAPDRSKACDGSIGDANHSARTSDHNPTSSGQVCAIDLTHDPAGGFDAHAFAERLLTEQDRRLKYVISCGRIGSGPSGVQPGVWRPYSGPNPHTQHAHVSVVAGPLGNDPAPWTLADPTEDDLTPQQAQQLDELHRVLIADPKWRSTLDKALERADLAATHAFEANAVARALQKGDAAGLAAALKAALAPAVRAELARALAD